MENQTKPLDLSQFDGHTPGPWRCVDRSEVSGVPSSLSTIPFAIECPVGSSVIPIADVCNFPEATPAQTAYQRANGRLLAAGPALLAECRRQRERIAELEAALKPLEELADSLSDDDCNYRDPEETTFCGALCQQEGCIKWKRDDARAALTKEPTNG